MDLINIVCPHCGFTKSVERHRIPQGARNTKCPKCQQTFLLNDAAGADSPQAGAGGESEEFTTDFEAKYCSTCGHKIHVKAEICPKCGVRAAPPAGAINKVALLLLTFFLGGMGGHRFYQRKYLLGVLYLLFFWTYIPTLVAWIEFIIYACKSEAELQQKYPQAGGVGVVLAIVIPFFAIGLLGILAAIAIPQFAAYRQQAYNATARSALTTCGNEAEVYFVDHQAYPTEAGQLECAAGTDVALYYLSLGPEEYRLISFHDRGNKAFSRRSSDGVMAEFDLEETKGEIEEQFGAAALESCFHFIE